ncbi:sugar kinase [Conexibacter sp. S30A1]|uniref:sugar kinase n=1 Tax=Conexibacter sp. S30A1 TaxID=2937800 RepID=UPI00200CE0D5|nr:sugar kinase [Conexibacter sp. S30A1]
MSGLAIKAREVCRWDAVALGEVMLRFDPGASRIATARSFEVWEGGGEYNVVRGLARCFGLRTGIVTALADNPLGRLVEGLIGQGGVGQAQLNWVAHDGVGRSVRNGLNFVERGYGVRPPLGLSDRGHTAVSQLKPGEIDWERIFASEGVRWFHCGGVFAGLSESTSAVAREAMLAARAHGTVISYDLNYRPSLWQALGGPERAAQVNRELVSLADVLLGVGGDPRQALGQELPHVEQGSGLDPGAHRALLAAIMDRHPNLQLVATAIRQVHSASLNDWGAVAHSKTGFVVGPRLDRLEIFDRIGGGDSFASGLIYGLLNNQELQLALSYGVAHGALAMTTPGDSSMATLAEVQRLVRGEASHVAR